MIPALQIAGGILICVSALLIAAGFITIALTEGAAVVWRILNIPTLITAVLAFSPGALLLLWADRLAKARHAARASKIKNL